MTVTAATFHVDAEIARQASAWRTAAALAPHVRSVLPAPGLPVAAVGCGSSWFMSMAFAGLREAGGQGLTDAYTASEFNPRRTYEHVIAITRSGTTSETVELLRSLRGRVPTTVITTVHGSPAEEAADHAIVLDFVDERAVMSTGSMTASLALLRAHMGEDLNQAADDVAAALAQPIDALTACEQIAFIGSGWTIGLAHEAALKTREAAQFWAEAHPAMDYRHGPISIAQPGRAVWSFGPAPSGLADEVRDTGALWESNSIDPMAHVVVAQRVAVQIAKLRGLDPDAPRNLARSIILD